MNRAYSLVTLSLIALISLSGCGGGGGSDECNDSVACIQPDPESIVDSSALLGAYDINYRLSLNTCGVAAPLAQLSEQYIAISGTGFRGFPTIEVSSNTGEDYYNNSSVENTDGESFFKVENYDRQRELPNFIPGMNCSELLTLSFFDIGVNKASVTRTSDISCIGSADEAAVACKVVYNGEGSFSPQ